jgi:hypothetical protein
MVIMVMGLFLLLVVMFYFGMIMMLGCLVFSMIMVV